jgi:hypothetical protein
MQLGIGKLGSYQTAEEMAKLVRQAAIHDIGLGNFAAQILVRNGLDSHSDQDDVVDAVFRYVQKFTYISDTTGTGAFDAVASARETMRSGHGDCDDLSVLLASLLALVGFRPSFVLAKMREASSGYDHVYVQVFTKKGRIALDPTTRKYGMGWESPNAIERVVFPIFTNGGAGAAGLGFTLPGLGAAAGGGIGGSIGGIIGAAAGFIPVIGPILGPVIGLLSGLFHHAGPTAGQRQLGSNFDVADKQVSAYLLTLNAKANNNTLTGSDLAEAVSEVNQLAQLAMTAMPQDASGYVTKQWKGQGSDIGEERRYAQWLTDLSNKVVPGSEGTQGGPGTGDGGPAGSGVNTTGSAGTIGSGAAGTTGSGITALLGGDSGSSLPVLLIGGLALLFFMSRR